MLHGTAQSIPGMSAVLIPHFHARAPRGSGLNVQEVCSENAMCVCMSKGSCLGTFPWEQKEELHDWVVVL